MALMQLTSSGDYSRYEINESTIFARSSLSRRKYNRNGEQINGSRQRGLSNLYNSFISRIEFIHYNNAPK